MDTLWLDIRYALRRLARSPGFTALAVLTLALGIGANNAIFTVVNGVLLHQVAVEDPDHLVTVYTSDERQKGSVFSSVLPVSELNFEDYRAQNTVFSGLVATQGAGMTLGSGGDPEQIGAMLASGNYFDVLGVRAMLGRTFLPEEDGAPGAHPVCVLSHALWQRRFGADRSLVGQTILLNGQAFTVVGVMPPSFIGTNTLGGPALWIPMAMHDQVLSGFGKDNLRERRFLNTSVLGRLKPGVTVARAEAEMRTIASQLERAYPVPNKGRSVHLVPLPESSIAPPLRAVLVRGGAVLMSVVAMVLLIACANLANLLLARSQGRHREIAVRIALGASRRRLMVQLMTESLLLALLGGAASFAVAAWARSLLIAHRPPFLQNLRADLVSFDSHVVLFTLGLAIVTGVLFGLAPALRASRQDLAVELKERTGIAGGARGFNLRNTLVVVEVTLSLLALIGAGLFVVSLRNAQRTDVGFNVDQVAILSFNIGSQGYTQERGQQFYRQLTEQVQGLPGVKSASLASNIPLFGGGIGRSVFPEGQEQGSNRSGVLVTVDSIAPNYFDTVQIPLLRGRIFTDSDTPNSQPVVVVNETFARRFWPSEDAINKRFKFFGDNAYTTVVGVVRDSKYGTVGEDPTPYIYSPLEQAYSPAVTLFVRSAGAPETGLLGARNQLHSLEPHLAITNEWTMPQVLDQSLWAPRAAAAMLGVFAILAVLLATSGIYGVMSYSVRQRVREIGVRMALGARPSDVLKLVIGQGMRLVGVGLVLGVAAGVALARLAASLLFGTAAGSWWMFGLLALVLALIAMLASYLPARRATKVDPLVALHYE